MTGFCGPVSQIYKMYVEQLWKYYDKIKTEKKS